MFTLPVDLANVYSPDTINSQYENCINAFVESSSNIMYYYMFGLFVYVIFAIKFKFCSFFKASLIGACVCVLFYVQHVNEYKSCVDTVTVAKNDIIDYLRHLSSNVTESMKHITENSQSILSEHEQIRKLVKEKLVGFES